MGRLEDWEITKTETLASVVQRIRSSNHQSGNNLPIRQSTNGASTAYRRVTVKFPLNVCMRRLELPSP
jgi:hypothetical protein